MARRQYWSVFSAATALTAVILIGCTKQDHSPDAKGAGSDSSSARPQPKLDASAASRPVPMAELMASAMKRSGKTSTDQQMPAGHPPTGAASMPAGHPPTGEMPTGHPPVGGDMGAAPPASQPVGTLKFTTPATWSTKPKRMMMVGAYGLPAAAGDSDDAELAVSFFPDMQQIPIQAHVKRWSEQFEQPDSTPAGGAAAKTTVVEGTAHPTTLVDISGRYRGSSMMGPASTLKDNHRMLAAVVTTDEGPYFFKLVGPAATVSAHEQEFMAVLRSAK